MRHGSILTLVPAALLAAAAALPAQDAEPGVVPPAPKTAPGVALSRTRGFELGLHVNAAAISPSDGTAERGLGGGLRLGYGVTDHVTVFAEGDGAAIRYADGPGTYTLVHVGLGVRGSFGQTAARVRPYLEGALVGVGVGDKIEGTSVTLSGGSVQGGGGVEYFVSPRTALDVGLELGPGSLTNASVDGDSVPMESINFTSVRLNVGFTFHP